MPAALYGLADHLHCSFARFPQQPHHLRHARRVVAQGLVHRQLAGPLRRSQLALEFLEERTLAGVPWPRCDWQRSRAHFASRLLHGGGPHPGHQRMIRQLSVHVRSPPPPPQTPATALRPDRYRAVNRRAALDRLGPPSDQGLFAHAATYPAAHRRLTAWRAQTAAAAPSRQLRQRFVASSQGMCQPVPTLSPRRTHHMIEVAQHDPPPPGFHPVPAMAQLLLEPRAAQAMRKSCPPSAMCTVHLHTPHPRRALEEFDFQPAFPAHRHHRSICRRVASALATASPRRHIRLVPQCSEPLPQLAHISHRPRHLNEHHHVRPRRPHLLSQPSELSGALRKPSFLSRVGGQCM